uniref:Ig-like domain-containing protein n=1 Tax=Strongyloides stercoralis TaxID=6248 RepID=A0A0K0E818_STRER
MRSSYPPFIIEKSNISRHENFPYIRLECFIFSKFIPIYTWHDGEIEIENDRNFLADCCDYGNGKYMCYLLIKKFDQTYDAVYKCTIENKYGKCIAIFNIKKNSMFYPDIVPGKPIDVYILNPKMVWKISVVDVKFANYQWYWGNKKISEYGNIFKSFILKYGNKNIIETQLMIRDPRIYIPANMVHCLLFDQRENCIGSYTFFCLPPLNTLMITDGVNIIANKILNNKISVVITIKYNSTTESTVRWYNRYGYKYECDENHFITNTQEDEKGNYIASLHFKEYIKTTSMIVCKIKNDKVDFLISIDTVLIDKKIFDLEKIKMKSNESAQFYNHYNSITY